MKNKGQKKTIHFGFVIIFFLLFTHLECLAQNNIGQIWKCNTVESGNLKTTSIVATTNVDTSFKIINVYIHLVKKSDGSGGLSEAQVNNWLSLLHYDYAFHSIFIQIIG